MMICVMGSNWWPVASGVDPAAGTALCLQQQFRLGTENGPRKVTDYTKGQILERLGKWADGNPRATDQGKALPT